MVDDFELTRERRDDHRHSFHTLRQFEAWTTCRGDLLQFLFGVHHLLDLGEREAQQFLEAADVRDAVDVFVGVEAETALHPLRRIEQALLFVKAEGALRDTGTLGDLADLIALRLGRRACGLCRHPYRPSTALDGLVTHPTTAL